MVVPKTLRTLLLLAACLLAACDLEVREQELRWRHDPETDELHVLFLHRDIGSPTPEKGASKLVELLEGRREFMLIDWPLYGDLDEEVTGEIPPLLASARSKVRVASASVGVSSDLELCGAQHFAIREWSAFLRDVNAAISAEVLTAFRAPNPDAFGWLDETTQKLWRERAELAGTWLGFDAQGLYFDLPAGPRGLALFLAMLLRESGQAEEPAERAIFDALGGMVDAFEPRVDGVRIRIGHADGAAWSLIAKRGEEVEKPARLRGAATQAGIVLAKWDEQRAVDAWLGRATPNKSQGAR
jgi:hypothetical protein